MESVSTKWLSLIIFKVASNDVRGVFRKGEDIQLKVVTLMCRRFYNETCLNNEVQPKYTNIYIHLHIPSYKLLDICKH